MVGKERRIKVIELSACYGVDIRKENESCNEDKLKSERLRKRRRERAAKYNIYDVKTDG